MRPARARRADPMRASLCLRPRRETCFAIVGATARTRNGHKTSVQTPTVVPPGLVVSMTDTRGKEARTSATLVGTQYEAPGASAPPRPPFPSHIYPTVLRRPLCVSLRAALDTNCSARASFVTFTHTTFSRGMSVGRRLRTRSEPQFKLRRRARRASWAARRSGTSCARPGGSPRCASRPRRSLRGWQTCRPRARLACGANVVAVTRDAGGGPETLVR